MLLLSFLGGDSYLGHQARTSPKLPLFPLLLVTAHHLPLMTGGCQTLSSLLAYIGLHPEVEGRTRMRRVDQSSYLLRFARYGARAGR